MVWVWSKVFGDRQRLLTTPETKLDRSQMRHFLKDKLPKYAIPSAFVAIDIFPQTTSGKIDYRALSNYEIDLITPETNSATLLDPLETQSIDLLKALGLTQEPFLKKDFAVVESSSDREDHFSVDRH